MTANCYVTPTRKLVGTWAKSGTRPLAEVELLIGRTLEVGEIVIIGRHKRHAFERLDGDHCQVFQRVSQTRTEAAWMKRPPRHFGHRRTHNNLQGPRVQRRWSAER